MQKTSQNNNLDYNNSYNFYEPKNKWIKSILFGIFFLIGGYVGHIIYQFIFYWFSYVAVGSPDRWEMGILLIMIPAGIIWIFCVTFFAFLFLIIALGKYKLLWLKKNRFIILIIIAGVVVLSQFIFLQPAEYYLYKASETNNSIFCRLIWYDIYTRSDCWTTLAVKNGDADVCRIGGYEPYQLINCYTEVAKQQKNPKLCDYLSPGLIEGVTNNNIKDNCLDDVQKAKDDSTPCEEINDPASKNQCYLNFAKENKNLTICKKIDWQSCEIDVLNEFTTYEECQSIQDSTGRLKDLCYNQIVKTIKDEKDCQKGEQLFRDICYAHLADIKPSPYLCENIKGNYFVGCVIGVALDLKRPDICNTYLGNILEQESNLKICLQAVNNAIKK